MSEQDLNLSSRLEAVLLAKLARQEERICMLEARLAQAEPVIETAPSLAAEREPIRLPEFNGPGVDAIAALVQEKAAERMCPVAAPDVLSWVTTAQPLPAEEAAEPGYERTARLNAPLLRRRHSARKELNYSVFRKAGSVALLSIAVAAMGVGLWQQRQSAFISASTPDTRPIPVLTPPAPLPAPRPFVSSSAERSIKPLRPTRLFVGKPPILEPESETPASPRHERRIVSLLPATLSGARSHLNSTAPQIASHAFASNAISPVRQIEHKQAATSKRGFKTSHGFRTHVRQTGVSGDNAQPVGSPQTSDTVRDGERPSVSRANSELLSNSDATPGNPQSFPSPESPEYRVGESSRRRYSADERERAEAARRAVGLSPRRRANLAESSEETRTNGEESPRRQLQGNSRRAMRTLDEMRDLLDSIERRKRHQADADSQ